MQQLIAGKKLNYSPALDGLRAICILFTIFNHVPNGPSFINGSVGVDVFFPLSGFLITYILLDTPRALMLSYYIRRLFRIAPLYYLAFIVTALAALAAHYFHIGESRLDQLKEVWLLSALFSREFVEDGLTLFGQAWTIGIEEKFYILFPLFLMLVKSAKEALVILVLGLVALIVSDAHAFFVRGYGGIVFGVTACLMYRKFSVSLPTTVSLCLIMFAYWCTFVVSLKYENLIVSFAASLLIVSLYSRQSWTRQILSSRLAVYLGKLTYSVYLFHVLIFFAVGQVLGHLNFGHWSFHVLIGYLVSVVACSAIYKIVERPLIIYGRNMATKVEFELTGEKVKA